MREHNSKWSMGGRVIDLAPFTVMGIINVTPDSFSDGGRFYAADKALAHAGELVEAGAAILDIGGESTRPGSFPVSAEEEKRRVLPLVRELTRVAAGKNDPARALISVDTWRGSTADAALEAGADIINDISGGLFDEAMADVLASRKPGCILGHCPEKPATMQKAPHYADVVEAVYAFFADRLERLEKKGLAADYVALDPGLGFGKTLRHNLALLRDLGEEKSRLHSLGRPICIGLSRKTMLSELLGLPKGPFKFWEANQPDSLGAAASHLERDAATQVFSALLLERGVFLHRVHAVSGTWNALRLAWVLEHFNIENV
ncbi:MAG: dihydropteroate synthase [Deltaproteobacteria bacterium]|nr:dihydropteroate synthase [Deltaproteobacteria bacterium]